MIDRAIIARINCDGTLPVTEYLRRDTALFASCEWSWTLDRAEACVFADYLLADAATEGHRYQDAGGRWHRPHAAVLGDPYREAERDRRKADAEAARERMNLAPEAVYAATSKRMGERD